MTLLVALSLAPPSFQMNMLDVGAGLMCVISIPDGNSKRYVVYDAGDGNAGLERVHQLIPQGSTIDWLILSHSDADHIGAAPEIMDEYKIKRIVRPNISRDRVGWRQVEAKSRELNESGATELFFANNPIVAPGKAYRTGKAKLTFVCGWNTPPSSWGLPAQGSEWLNAGSIVVKLEYAGKAILLTGDEVGRDEGSPGSNAKYTESYMIKNSARVPIKADVMTAPHHGGDDCSSLEWIRAVSPKYVLFSSGHKYGHPLNVTALRYLAAGLTEDRMLRTDRGDDEGSKEWSLGRVNGTIDPKGDDEVFVRIKADGMLSVGYASP